MGNQLLSERIVPISGGTGAARANATVVVTGHRADIGAALAEERGMD